MLSGGVSLLDDLRRLKRLGLGSVVGIIVGRAFYEKWFTLEDAMRVLEG